MIIWLNGAFGSGKTTCAFELHRRLPDSFVYDPENIGYFIRKNTPREMHKPDFQDHEEWRAFNLAMLRRIYGEYPGTIIVPMTINNPDYYNEIIRKLISEGTVLKHIILNASRETLIKRLNKRIERGETWARAQIDKCIYAFTHDITGEKIITDNRSVDSIIEEIAQKCGLTLLNDKRGHLRKLIDRYFTLLKHIR